MDVNELLDPFERLLEDVCAPAAIREIEAGGSTGQLWDAIEESGFLDALVPEEAGGVGLTLAQVAPLLQALGRFAVPVPVGETMIARALLAGAGMERPAGPIVLATGAGSVPGAGVAEYVLADDGSQLSLGSMTEPTPTGVHGSLAGWVSSTGGKSLERPAGGLRPIAAVVRACAIAGAADRVLAMTLSYANERVQFGKPIGKQQVIQQQLAVLAERTVACRLAAQLGAAGGLPPNLANAATAKQVTSSAAVEIANIAHAVHGAIGVSEEYDLQLYSRRLHEWRLADGAEGYWAKLLGELRLQRSESRSVDFIREEMNWEGASA